MKEATAFVEEIKFNNEAVTDHQMKYAEVMHELLLKHGCSYDDPSPNQLINNEPVIEYDDNCSEFEYNDECCEIREYDSDDDKFYYD